MTETARHTSGVTDFIGGPQLPEPRGPLSGYVIGSLRQPVHRLVEFPDIDQAWDGDDLQLALYVCYELHYRSFAGVDERWEWEPSLLSFRRELETAFETGLRDLVAAPPAYDVVTQLWEMARAPSSRSLSAFMLERGTHWQLREFLVHRSAYQLKEADPHTWVIPRLDGDVKAAVMQIQADEYGNGVEPEMHSSLFASTLRAVDLDPSYGAYLDWIPAPTLVTVNLVSLFGLHRRWRGALVGHLAMFEMTSVTPMTRYAAALRRMGVSAEGCRFYEVHVEADAEHELIASHRMAAGLAASERALSEDVLFGASAVTAVENRFAQHLLDRWEHGDISLRRPLPTRP